MKFLAQVVENYPDKNSPSWGCIKVTCPELFGATNEIAAVNTPDAVKASLNVSDWVFPCFRSEADYDIPDLGDYVFIEQVGNRPFYIWTGVAAGLTDDNELTGQARAGINPNVSNATDRIFGMKNGSFMRFRATGEGEITIQCLGINAEREEALGPTLTMRYDIEGQNRQFIIGVGERYLLSVNDRLGSDDNEGILLSDTQSESAILISNTGVAITMKDKGIVVREQEIIVKAPRVSAVCDNLEVTSTSATVDSDTVTVTAQQVKIDGGQTEIPGQVAPNQGPFCAIPNCMFTGSPHTGKLAVK